MPKLLSPHFTLEELTVSQEATRRNIDNTPSAATVANLRRLSAELENVRTLLGDPPILVSSGYRSLALNTFIGGAVNSMHMQGLAADFTAPNFGTVFQTARALAASGIAFDQLIYEFGNWVHIGFAPEGVAPRLQKLSIFAGTGYLVGIVGRPAVG